MAEDDTVVPEPTEPQEPVEPKEPTDPQPENPQEDYRGKLNATNGFLKKEGYVFDETKKQWHKPTPAAPPEPSSPVLSAKESERIDRIELSSMDIKDREQQDFVLAAAKRLGVEPAQAAVDPIVAAKLKQMAEVKASKDATPPPRNGSAPSRGNGKLPDFSKMSDKEFDDWRRKSS